MGGHPDRPGPVRLAHQLDLVRRNAGVVAIRYRAQPRRALGLATRDWLHGDDVLAAIEAESVHPDLESRLAVDGVILANACRIDRTGHD